MIDDSNAWIVHLRSKGTTAISSKIQSTSVRDLRTCPVVRAELLTGAYKSLDPVTQVGIVKSILAPIRSVPFDDVAAEEYARIRAALERTGQKIGAYDRQIAAIALVNNLILVTHNTAEFSRVPGLRFEDWQ